MAIDLTPDQRELGMANYRHAAEGLSRRGFMKSLALAGGAIVPVSAAVYFGYESLAGKPVNAILTRWDAELAEFRKTRERYLLYR